MAGSVASALAALAFSRAENGHAARPINAISHIYDGAEPPPAHNGRGCRNTLLGATIHTAASVWWAIFYEASAPRKPREAIATAAAISTLAYYVDYHVVHRRFRPGFEAHLSPRGLFAVYAGLAAGFAAAALVMPRSSGRRAGRSA